MKYGPDQAQRRIPFDCGKLSRTFKETFKETLKETFKETLTASSTEMTQRVMTTAASTPSRLVFGEFNDQGDNVQK
jgi:hypothetical protein